MKDKHDAATERGASRRRFTKSAAAALAAAPAILAAAAGAQETRPAAPTESKAPPNPQATPTPAPPQQTPPSPVVEAYAAVARARFGAGLSEEEFERVKRDLAGNARAAKSLSDAKLKNSDEPDFVFSA